MKIINFFNCAHNGDVHLSREFVKDIINKTNCDDYEYWHINKPNLLKDLDLGFGNPQNLDRQKQKSIEFE